MPEESRKKASKKEMRKPLPSPPLLSPPLPLSVELHSEQGNETVEPKKACVRYP